MSKTTDFLPVPIDEAELGPAMRALNPRQRLFVQAYLHIYPPNASKAARIAGYSDAGNGAARVRGYELLHSEKVKSAMIEEARRLVAVEGLPIGLHTLKTVAADPKHKDCVRASLALLNRGGLHETVEKNVNVNVEVSEIEKIKQIWAFAINLGIDPYVLVGSLTEEEYAAIPDDMKEKANRLAARALPYIEPVT